VVTPKGEISALRPPPVITGFDQPMGAVPGLGEHTEAILAELGLSEPDVAALRRQGAIGASYPRSE
jgi:crotonobetainyl-CoA:carnitine CoA-transferase CaiB-like acyl-CoA transferase